MATKVLESRDKRTQVGVQPRRTQTQPDIQGDEEARREITAKDTARRKTIETPRVDMEAIVIGASAADPQNVVESRATDTDMELVPIDLTDHGQEKEIAARDDTAA